LANRRKKENFGENMGRRGKKIGASDAV